MKKLLPTFLHVFENRRWSTLVKFQICWIHLKLRLLARFNPGASPNDIVISIFGQRVAADSFETLSFLFYEIFILEAYFFQAYHAAPVIFDCGANIGMATVYFKWLYPKAVVHCFEPQPLAFDFLQRNTKSLDSISLNACALADFDGYDLFYFPSKQVSLLASSDKSRLDSDGVKIQMARLSNWIESPIDLIKIDVEGAEWSILHDLDEWHKLALCRQMIIEYHHHMGVPTSKFSSFLALIERNNFNYQLRGNFLGLNSFQDLILHCYQSS